MTLTDPERAVMLVAQHRERQETLRRYEAKAQALCEIVAAQELLGLTSDTLHPDLRQRLDAFCQWLSAEYEAAADAGQADADQGGDTVQFIRAEYFRVALRDARRAQRTVWVCERYRADDWGSPEVAKDAAHARAAALRVRHWQVEVSEIRGLGESLPGGPSYGIMGAAPMQPMPPPSAPERIVQPQPVPEGAS